MYATFALGNHTIGVHATPAATPTTEPTQNDGRDP